MNRNMTRKHFVALGAYTGASLALGLVGCTQESASGTSVAAHTASKASEAPSSATEPSESAQQSEGTMQAPSSVQDQASSQEQPAGAETAVQPPAAEFSIPDKTLASGFAIPALGLGTWTLSDEVAEESVYTALGYGYRLLDTAQYYGNETGVGNGVRRAVEDGTVARENVFVTSKIMPSSSENAAESIDESLGRLGLGYIDLMLIHQPGSNDEAVWRSLEDAVREGKVRSIGISNYYTPEKYDTVASIAETPVALVQNENHPYYQNNDLQAYVEGSGGFVESWYPLGGRPGVARMLADEALGAIAQAHGKTVAQTILRWHVQSGYIAIPGSSNPDHIAENIQIFDFALTEDEMAQIATLNGIGRFENW